jgi:hypothetical protein
MSKNGLVTAKFLQAKDVFRMGGLRYRILTVEEGFKDHIVITFTSTHPDSEFDEVNNNTMEVHPHTIFKIYELAS